MLTFHSDDHISLIWFRRRVWRSVDHAVYKLLLFEVPWTGPCLSVFFHLFFLVADFSCLHTVNIAPLFLLIMNPPAPH